MNISDEEMALISKDVVNLLAEKGCTVAEACEILRKAERCIGATADVKKIKLVNKSTVQMSEGKLHGMENYRFSLTNFFNSSMTAVSDFLIAPANEQ